MYKQNEINDALLCLISFKQGYKEENGTITIGEIKGLIDKIDLIKDCVEKQRRIPTNDVPRFNLFGELKQIYHYCASCNSIVDSTCGNKFCPKCGQRFYI